MGSSHGGSCYGAVWFLSGVAAGVLYETSIIYMDIFLRGNDGSRCPGAISIR